MGGTQLETITHGRTETKSFVIHSDASNGVLVANDSSIILVTSANVNVGTTRSNVFIKSGSGQDALNASAVSGNNTLDGSRGNSFLTGSLTGHNTFVIDDHGATTPQWSTVVNLHAGDDVTVFGIPSDVSKLPAMILEPHRPPG